MEQVSRHEVERSGNPLSITPVETPKQPLLPVQRLTPRAPAAPLGGQSCIGAELTVVGTITGKPTPESLFIDGCVEGGVELPGSRVTVGPNGLVKAGIVACDIVVLGQVLGDLAAAHRIDIRAKGSVIGNACAPRVSIEDGANFQGMLSAGAASEETKTAAAGQAAPEPERLLAARPARAQAEVRKQRAQSALQPA